MPKDEHNPPEEAGCSCLLPFSAGLHLTCLSPLPPLPTCSPLPLAILLLGKGNRSPVPVILPMPRRSFLCFRCLVLFQERHALCAWRLQGCSAPCYWPWGWRSSRPAPLPPHGPSSPVMINRMLPTVINKIPSTGTALMT